MPNKIVNVGLHLQILKFGPVPDPTQPTLDDQVNDVAAVGIARKNNISKIGIELSYAENRALFAVQRLLDDTNYKGNIGPKVLSPNNSFNMSGNIPRLNIKISEYLDAYGVAKKRSSRGKNEYNAQARRSALDALESLANKKFLYVYVRERYHQKQLKRKVGTDLIETVGPIISVSRNNRMLQIEPSPILFDQIETYYMILPANLYSQIQRRQRSLLLFIEYLFYLYEMQRRTGKARTYQVTRHFVTLGYEIGLGNLIESRQLKQLRLTLNEYYKYAQEIGYLRKFDIDAAGARYEKVDKLYINAATMAKLRKV